MQDQEDFVTITHGVRGYFAVLMSWDDDMQCHVPWNSGFGSYTKPENAIPEAQQWAEAEEVKFKPYQPK